MVFSSLRVECMRCLGHLLALLQSNLKRLFAYSSIAHMGFVTLGFFMFSALGLEGALVQMISHGFISAAMFLCVGVGCMAEEAEHVLNPEM